MLAFIIVLWVFCLFLTFSNGVSLEIKKEIFMSQNLQSNIATYWIFRYTRSFHSSYCSSEIPAMYQDYLLEVQREEVGLIGRYTDQDLSLGFGLCAVSYVPRFLWFPSTTTKHAIKWTGYTKLPLPVCVCGVPCIRTT